MSSVDATYDLMKLHDKLRIYAERTDINQTDLGKLAGVTQPQVKKWYSGENKPNIFQLAKLAEYLNVSIDHLVDESQPVLDASVLVRLKAIRDIIEEIGAEEAWIRLVAIPGRDERGLAREIGSAKLPLRRLDGSILEAAREDESAGRKK